MRHCADTMNKKDKQKGYNVSAAGRTGRPHLELNQRQFLRSHFTELPRGGAAGLCGEILCGDGL